MRTQMSLPSRQTKLGERPLDPVLPRCYIVRRYSLDYYDFRRD